jgi:hypothetical protein
MRSKSEYQWGTGNEVRAARQDRLKVASRQHAGTTEFLNFLDVTVGDFPQPTSQYSALFSFAAGKRSDKGCEVAQVEYRLQ